MRVDDPDLLEEMGRLHREVLGLVLVDLERALELAQQALELARRYPDMPLVQARAQWTYGSAIIYRLDYIAALSAYDKALQAYDLACHAYSPAQPPVDVRVVQINRVFCLTELGRYTEAEAAAEAAAIWLAKHDSSHARLILLLNRSVLAGRKGDYRQMVKLADMARKLARNLKAIDREAQAWINIGYAQSFLGQLDAAAHALKKGIPIAQKAGETLTVARGLWNWARVLRCQGRLFEALSTLREAEHGLAQAPGEVATVALEEASLYAQLYQLPEAQDAACRAAEQFAALQMVAYSADAALQAARLAVRRRRSDEAVELLALAMEQASRTVLPALNAEIELAETSLALLPGKTDLRSKRDRQRRDRQRRDALRIATAATNRLDRAGFVREAEAGNLIVASLHALLGETSNARSIYERLLVESGDPLVRLEATAQIAALSSSAPIEALPYLKRAAEFALEQRRALPLEELQARFSVETSSHHLRLGACLLSLDNPTEALHSVWVAKAGPLLDLRAVQVALDPEMLNLITAERAQLAIRRERVYDCQRRIQAATMSGVMADTQLLGKELIEAQQDVTASERSLTRKLQSLSGRGGQAEVPVVASLDALLPAEAALIEFAHVDDKLISFLVRPGEAVRVHYHGSYRSLLPRFDHWLLVRHQLQVIPFISAASRAHLKNALAPFWDRLLAPWQTQLDAVSHLIVAPCDVLYHLPWAAIPCGDAQLCDRFTLELTVSGGLWGAPPPTVQVQPGSPRLLGYAGKGERRLEHIEAELQAAQTHLPKTDLRNPASSRDLTDLCNPAFSPDFQIVPPPVILHIAAHALTSPEAPICSTIELEDGPFLLLQAHRLALRGTELVILSGCETAVRPDHGDMTLALAGSFLCAGARQVMASLWQVNDAATADLMSAFYSAFAQSRNAAAALRDAQRIMREASLLDWAAFQVWSGAHSQPWSYEVLSEMFGHSG